MEQIIKPEEIRQAQQESYIKEQFLKTLIVAYPPNDNVSRGQWWNKDLYERQWKNDKNYKDFKITDICIPMIKSC